MVLLDSLLSAVDRIPMSRIMVQTEQTPVRITNTAESAYYQKAQQRDEIMELLAENSMRPST
jgi:hypothetical protein